LQKLATSRSKNYKPSVQNFMQSIACSWYSIETHEKFIFDAPESSEVFIKLKFKAL